MWFRTLERIPIRAKWPGAIARMSLDQFLFAPFVLTGEFWFSGRSQSIETFEDAPGVESRGITVLCGRWLVDRHRSGGNAAGEERAENGDADRAHRRLLHVHDARGG